MYNPFFLFETESRNKEHKYLVVSQKRVEGRIPFATLILIEQYSIHVKQTPKQWKLDTRPFHVTWEKDKKPVRSKDINYRIILDNIKSNILFVPDALNLPYTQEEFLDIITTLGHTNHIITNENKPNINVRLWNSEHFLGDNFPITPILIREGIIISSFLDSFFRRIVNKRLTLIESSDTFFSFEWFFNFRDLINDAISSIEIALHLVYNKAQFHPNIKWTFDEQKLGSKYGRRFKDKLKWVHQISGNTFEIEKYKASLDWLQELRNHLNHFDPPCFCMTIEECAKVLNAIIDVGMVHIAMRKALGLKVSITLINFVLQPSAEFVPEELYKRRLPSDYEDEGYNTCRWPTKEKEV